jgi:methionine aminopeptidase
MIEEIKKVPKNLRLVYNDILKRFGTLAFCKRYLNYNSVQNKSFNKLVKKGYIKGYPPLYDVKNSYIAQTEKSIFITETNVLVLN